MLLIAWVVKNAFGVASIYYRYNKDGFQPIKPYLSEPAVSIDMYSSLRTEPHVGIEPFFLLRDFLPFIDSFKKFDIAKIVLMCAAAHAQLPKDAKGHIDDVARDFPREYCDCNIKLSEVAVDLDSCSREQYKNLYLAAKPYSLLGDKNSFVPIMINHVSIGFFAHTPLAVEMSPAISRGVAHENN